MIKINKICPMDEFRKQANIIRAKYTIVDGGLEAGELLCKSSVEFLRLKIPKLFHNDEIPLGETGNRELINLYKNVEWGSIDKFSQASAQGFVLACMLSGVGIIIK